MTPLDEALTLAGPAAFGLVVGWVTYRTLRRNAAPVDLKDLASVVGVVGGGVVTALFGEPALFGSYSVGLAVGFFLYLTAAKRMDRERMAAIEAEIARLEAKGGQVTPEEADGLAKLKDARLKALDEGSAASWMSIPDRRAKP